MRLTLYSVKRRLATSAIVLALTVLGVYGLWRLPVDFLPAITYPLIKVHIWWSGATPEEIDRSIADPLESQMASVDSLDFMESSSIEGMYTLQANFKYDVDVNVAYQDVLAAMARVARELPKDMDPPVVIKADPSLLPVVQMTVNSDQWDLVRIRTWVDTWLQDQLLSVPGVAGTEIVGGLKREIRVHLDSDALEKYGIALTDVIKRLRDENIEQFGGRVTVGSKEIIAKTMGEYQTLDDIRNVLLSHDGPAKVHLHDVAEVTDAHENARVITRMNGKPSVKLSVLKQADANTVEVAEAVNLRIQQLEAQLPQGISLGMVENQAEYVQKALDGVRNSAIEAAILVILIVWLFLGSWRQVLVIMTALPLTLILNFGLMKLAGFSLNIFSLGGLVIAIGILVDNSILVLETITRHRHEQPDAPTDELVIEATGEIGPAIVAATLSFLALFIPFLLVPGLVSLLFRELILVIAGIVVISLVMAVSVTPMLTAIILGRNTQQRASSRFQLFFDLIAEKYGQILRRALRGRWIILTVFIAVLLVSLFFSKDLGREFLPKMDDGRIVVKVKLPTGASLAETDHVLAEIEKTLQHDDRIESIFTLSGGKVWGLYTYEIANEGELDIQLKPRSHRNLSTKKYIEYLLPIVGKVSVPGGKIIVMPMKTKGIRQLGNADIEVKIKGQDVATLYALARQIAGIMNKLDHFKNVYVSMDMTKPEYRIQVDRRRAAELGIAVSDIAETMRSLINGAVTTQYRDGDDYFNVRVIVSEDKLLSRRDVENLPVQLRQGGFLRLKDVATVQQTVGPVEIIREDQVKQVIVRGDALGASVGQALTELQQQLDNAGEKPFGYEYTFGGQAQMMDEMTESVLRILAFAVFFAFIVLTVQFNSLKLPALILGSVPFCLSGLIFIMFFTGLPLGATVIIGVLVIIAATVNNGVLLFTFANELREKEKLPLEEAVLQASKIRLRPRLMTTIAVLVGFIPLALAFEEGGDMLQPMAAAAIGGLLMDMLVALFLMPCLYVITSSDKK